MHIGDHPPVKLFHGINIAENSIYEPMTRPSKCNPLKNTPSVMHFYGADPQMGVENNWAKAIMTSRRQLGPPAVAFAASI